MMTKQQVNALLRAQKVLAKLERDLAQKNIGDAVSPEDAFNLGYERSEISTLSTLLDRFLFHWWEGA